MIFFAPLIMVHVFWNVMLTESYKQHNDVYANWIKLLFPNMTVCGA